MRFNVVIIRQLIDSQLYFVHSLLGSLVHWEICQMFAIILNWSLIWLSCQVFVGNYIDITLLQSQVVSEVASILWK